MTSIHFALTMPAAASGPFEPFRPSPRRMDETEYEGEPMLTVNHVITAGILVFLIAFSPMSISMLGDRAPLVGSLTTPYN